MTVKELSCIQSTPWRIARYKAVVDAFASDIRAGRLPAGDPAADPSSARRPRGHRPGDRVARLRRAGGHGPGQRRAGPRHVRPRHRRCRPATASTSRPRRPTPSTSTSTTPPCPGRPTCCARALRELAASGDLEALLRYQPHRGRPHDRAAVARHLRLRGLAVDADQVLIVNGAQHGLAVTVMATLQAGRRRRRRRPHLPGLQGPRPARFGSSWRRCPSSRARTRSRRPRAAVRRPAGPRRLRDAHPAQPARLGHGRGPPARGWSRSRAGTGCSSSRTPPTPTSPRTPPPPIAALAPDITVYVSGLSKSVGDRAARRLRRGPGRAGARDRARDPRHHLEHPGHHHRDRLPLARRRHRRPARGRQARRRQRPAVDRPRRPGRPAAGRPPVVLLRLASAGRRTPGPTGSRRSLAGKGISVATAEPFATSAPVPQALRLALGSADLDSLRRALARGARGRRDRSLPVEDSSAPAD